jgi:hypothetical protein
MLPSAFSPTAVRTTPPARSWRAGVVGAVGAFSLEGRNERERKPPYTAMEKLRIVILGFGTARQKKWSLNDGQIQNPSGTIVDRAAI